MEGTLLKKKKNTKFVYLIYTAKTVTLKYHTKLKFSSMKIAPKKIISFLYLVDYLFVKLIPT